MIYFAQAVDGGPIKIGTSEDVPARVKQLEATYNRPLALLATLPGGRDEERAIHERFSFLRFGKTEQFRPDPALLAFIGRPLFVSAAPVVEAMEPVGKVIHLDGEVAHLAKIVAAFQGVSLSRFLSETLRPIVAAQLQEELEKRTKPKPPKR